MNFLWKPIPGILVELAISWLLIWAIEKKNLRVLGLIPTQNRLIACAFFFLVTAFCCALQFLMRILIAHEQWQINPAVSWMLIVKGTWWTLFSVLYEELIFRGVVLYILIKRIGEVKAILISSIAFGIYHWFSYGLFWNIPMMIYIFIVTACFGFVLAYAYSKTLSLYIPIGIHFGWNIVNAFLFSQGSIGAGLFTPVKNQPKVMLSYFTYYSITLVPIILVIVLNYFLLRKFSLLTEKNK